MDYVVSFPPPNVSSGVLFLILSVALDFEINKALLNFFLIMIELDVSFLLQAQDSIADLSLPDGWGRKHRLFVQWKCCEAKVCQLFLHLVIDIKLLTMNYMISFVLIRIACLFGQPHFIFYSFL